MERYFYSDQHKLYRTTDTSFSDGTPTVRLQRYSWIFKNWNGHIHNHEETRKKIKNLDGIKEITPEEADHIIKN